MNAVGPIGMSSGSDAAEARRSYKTDVPGPCPLCGAISLAPMTQRDEELIESLQARYYNATAGSKSLRPGEQDKIEKAIAVKRAEAAEDKLNRIRDALSNAPECDKYDDDDVIVCGWKRDMQSVRMILDGSDT